MAEKREEIGEQLSALADDLKSLYDSIVHDPKEQARKERRWRALNGFTGAIFTLAARQVATRAWRILTGEVPPAKRGGVPQQPPRQQEQQPPEPTGPSERATETATAR